MRKVKVFMHEIWAGVLEETDEHKYIFRYNVLYEGPPISLVLPVRKEPYLFNNFPPFFDGVLPEGVQLMALLKRYKIDSRDYFSQLLAVGEDLVGAVTVREYK